VHSELVKRKRRGREKRKGTKETKKKTRRKGIRKEKGKQSNGIKNYKLSVFMTPTQNWNMEPFWVLHHC
jgi:hypothetical protein